MLYAEAGSEIADPDCVSKLQQGKWGDPAMSTSKDLPKDFIPGIPRGCCKSK